MTPAELFAYDNPAGYRRLLLKLRYAVPETSRWQVANVMAGILTSELGFTPPPAPHGGVDQIRRCGYVHLGRMTDEAHIVREALSGHRLTDGWGRAPGEFGRDEIPLSVHVAHYSKAAIAAAPLLACLANHPLALGLAAHYLGATPSIGYLSLWWSLAGRAEPEDAELYHVDKHDWRWLKLFVYLTDVDDGSGPHCYVRGTHNPKLHHDIAGRMAGRQDADLAAFERMMRTQRKRDEDIERFFGRTAIERFTGPAGTAFVTDSAGIHKGELCRTADRLVFSALYTLLPTCKPTEAPQPVDCPDFLPLYRARFGDGVSDEQLRYVNRFVMRF